MSGPLSVSIGWWRSSGQSSYMTDHFTASNGAAWSSVKWDIGQTPTGGSALIQGNAGRLTTGTAGAYAVASRVSRRVLSSFGVKTNMVYRSRFRWPTGDECYPSIVVRATAGSLDLSTGYRILLDRTNSQWSVGRIVSSVITNLASPVSFTFTSGTWYWVEFGALGTTIRAKVWADGAAEPAHVSLGVSTSAAASFTDTTDMPGIAHGVSVGAGNIGNALFEVDDVEFNSWFTDTSHDDVTDLVRGGITVQYGREQNTALAPTVAGIGSFGLDNRSRTYSPRNTASPLYGNIKPARPVVITRLVGATTYTIARMHTDDSPINPDVSAKTVQVGLIDSLADFRSTPVSTELYQALQTGEAISYILDAVGWTGGRDLDAGATVIPWFWAEGPDAFAILSDLISSEGSPAYLTIDANGTFVFRDRHHRLTRTASTVPQDTWRSIGPVEPVMAPGFTFDSAWRNVINNASVSVSQRNPDNKLSVVWTSDDTYTMEPLSFRTIYIQTTDPFKDAVAPVSGTDYLDRSGAHTVSISRTSGAATSVQFFAGPAGATIVGLQLRARSVPVVRTIQVSASDSTSIDDYGSRGLPSGSDPVWAGEFDAQSLCDLAVLQRAQPLAVISVRFSCAQNQTARLKAALSTALSDRITIVESETALNDPFFVESVTHNITSVAEHEVTFDLEAVPDLPAARPFQLDTDVLNGSAVLGL